jgi:hypothetical protein
MDTETPATASPFLSVTFPLIFTWAEAAKAKRLSTRKRRSIFGMPNHFEM